MATTDSLEKFETKWRSNEGYKTAYVPLDLKAIDFDRLLLASTEIAGATFVLTPGYPPGVFTTLLVARITEDTSGAPITLTLFTEDEFAVANPPIFYPVPSPQSDDTEEEIPLAFNVRKFIGMIPAAGSVGALEFYGVRTYVEDFEDGWVSVL